MGSQSPDQQNLQTILLSDDGDDGASGGAADKSTSASHSIYKSTLTSASSFLHPLATSDPLSPPPPPGDASVNLSGDVSCSVSGRVSGNLSGEVSGDASGLYSIYESTLTSASSFLHPLATSAASDPPPPPGDVSGNLSRDVSFNISGDVSCRYSGNLSGDSSDRLSPPPPGSVSGNLSGDGSCNNSGDVSGRVSGDVSGDLSGIGSGDVSCDVSGRVSGDVAGDLSGIVSGDASSSYSIYKSTLTSASSFHHPLSTSPDSDRLSAPPSPGDVSGDFSVNVSSTVPGEVSVNVSGIVSGDVSGNVSAPVKSDYLRVSVSDPKKETDSESNNSYMTYLITTETDLADYKGSKFSVRRRFKEFVLLSERLAEAYRGFFVPVRPDKGLVEGQVMQKQEFVEQRRVAVERYLRRLARHRVIRRSEELRVFLIGEGRVILGGGNEIVSKTKLVRGGDLMRLFRGVKQRARVDWGGGGQIMEEEDKEFLEKKEKLNQLEKELSNASKQAESLVKAQQKMGETVGELGLAFFKLTKFENEQATSVAQRNRASDMKSIATAAVRTGRFHRGLNAVCVKHLDTLHEYMGLMLAVHHAFSDRSSALLTVRTLISESSSLHAKAKKLEIASSKKFGGDKSRPHKMDELEEAIRVAENAKRSALREYECIKENNRSEIERLDRERKGDFMSMLKGFVTNQVAYAEKIGTEWAKVAEETSRYAKESE